MGIGRLEVTIIDVTKVYYVPSQVSLIDLSVPRFLVYLKVEKSVEDCATLDLGWDD